MTMSDDWKTAGEEAENRDEEGDCPPKKARHNGYQQQYYDQKQQQQRQHQQNQIVHSGHFMKSNIHEETSDDDEFTELDGWRSCSLTSHSSKDSLSPQLDPMAMDDLKVLLQNISKGYSTWFTSPSWTNFKGVHLLWKDKARMNNLIWRAWHLQFVCGHRATFCKFTCPLDDPVHRKPQAVVLEGKYWRRRLDAVTEEYKRWRIYWMMVARRRRHESGEGEDDSRLSLEQLLDMVPKRSQRAHLIYYK